MQSKRLDQLADNRNWLDLTSLKKLSATITPLNVNLDNKGNRLNTDRLFTSQHSLNVKQNPPIMFKKSQKKIPNCNLSPPNKDFWSWKNNHSIFFNSNRTTDKKKNSQVNSLLTRYCEWLSNVFRRL